MDAPSIRVIWDPNLTTKDVRGLGERGLEPKPTALRVLHGDRKDQINNAEPIPPGAEFIPPEELSDVARAVWGRLAPSLISVGTHAVGCGCLRGRVRSLGALQAGDEAGQRFGTAGAGAERVRAESCVEGVTGGRDDVSAVRRAVRDHTVGPFAD